MLKRIAFLGICLALLGCEQTPPTQTGFRDTNVPLSVTTRGGADTMNGPWFVRSFFPGTGSIAMVTFLANHQGSPAIEFLQAGCDLSSDCETTGDLWTAQSLGLNRWRLTSGSSEKTRELWVVWVDEGGRTAALGTPDGSFGWIVDRKLSGGEDRIEAAREILAFNGYDVARLITRKAR